MLQKTHYLVKHLLQWLTICYQLWYEMAPHTTLMVVLYAALLKRIRLLQESFFTQAKYVVHNFYQQSSSFHKYAFTPMLLWIQNLMLSSVYASIKIFWIDWCYVTISTSRLPATNIKVSMMIIFSSEEVSVLIL